MQVNTRPYTREDPSRRLSMSVSPLVLIVEDENSIRQCLAELLELEGFRTLCACDGEEALQVLDAATELPQLILLDLAMPNLDGYGFRREQVKSSKYSEVPVVILSADSRIESIARELGGIEFLRKPIDIDSFLSSVKKYSRE